MHFLPRLTNRKLLGQKLLYLNGASSIVTMWSGMSTFDIIIYGIYFKPTTTTNEDEDDDEFIDCPFGPDLIKFFQLNKLLKFKNKISPPPPSHILGV